MSSNGADHGANQMPGAEVDITHDLVVSLLRRQHPDLADLELRPFANGWDNVIFRLGDDLVVRLPRRAAAAALVEHEQRWLPLLAPRLPLPIPAPVRVGHPALGYPWAWSIAPWFDGEAAADAILAEPAREARRLGAFMAALHEAAPPDAPANPLRQGFIGDRSERFAAIAAQVRDLLDRLAPSGFERAQRRWAELADTERFGGSPTWVAGDVHSANIIVADGAISAVIDFGDLCAGDPAVDLAVAWMLFGPSDRAIFRTAASQGAVAVDEAMWHRAEAWAWYFAVAYLANSADDARLRRMGHDLFLTLVEPAIDTPTSPGRPLV